MSVFGFGKIICIIRFEKKRILRIPRIPPKRM